MGMSAGLGLDGLRSGVCTSTTRPAAPYEGQMIYETDTDMVALWNGSAWRYIAATTPTNGTVLQVVTYSDSSSRYTTSNYPVASGFNATITPKSSSSKILVMANVSAYATGDGTDTNKIGIYGLSYGSGSTTSIYRTRFSSYFAYSAGSDTFGTVSMSVLHSPATTSACIYNVLYGRYSSGYNNSVYINGDAGAGASGTSTMTLMEIAG